MLGPGAMLRNITLSADGDIIDAAREKALENKTTLNDEFRRWLADYARIDESRRDRAAAYQALMHRLRHVSISGRKPSRDEMNER